MTVEVKPSYGLAPETVEQMLIDSYEHAESDMAERNLRVERVEAERILSATRAAVETDGELVDESSREAIAEGLDVLQAAHDGDDHLAIRRAIERLDEVSHPLAETRMNRAVRSAVRGRRVTEVEQAVEKAVRK